MCVIIVCRENVPDLSTIEACDASNPHGIGVSWRDSGGVEYRKGLSAAGAYSIVQSVRLPIVMHFRLASAGSADNFSLNHPFPLSKSAYPLTAGRAKRVLFHNGHVVGWESLLMQYLNASKRKFSGAWSDTRLAALVASSYGDGVLPVVFPSQKFVLFDAASIKIIGNWEKPADGMQFSNYYWKAPVVATRAAYPGVTWYEDKRGEDVPYVPARYRIQRMIDGGGV